MKARQILAAGFGELAGDRRPRRASAAGQLGIYDRTGLALSGCHSTRCIPCLCCRKISVTPPSRSHAPEHPGTSPEDILIPQAVATFRDPLEREGKCIFRPIGR